MVNDEGAEVRMGCDLDEVRREIQALIAKLDRVIEGQQRKD